MYHVSEESIYFWQKHQNQLEILNLLSDTRHSKEYAKINLINSFKDKRARCFIERKKKQLNRQKIFK